MLALSGLPGSHRNSARIAAGPGFRLVARAASELAGASFVEQWQKLACRALEPNPFHESWFLLPAIEALDAAGDVRVLCLESTDRLAGLLPLRREGRYYGHPLPHWRAWLHANSFLGAPLVAPGFELVFWRELLAWCDAHAGTATFLHLPELPLDGPLYAALREIVERQHRPSALVHRCERAMLRSNLSPAAYFERSLGKKHRKEFQRREKRLSELGALSIERLRDGTGIGPWIAEFLALERKGWKGAAGSALASHPDTEALFTRAARAAAERGRLDRLTLRLDGRAIAALATFLAPPGAFTFKTAYDEAFARSSPGLFLQREFLGTLDDPDIAWCDSCAAPDHPMIDRFWRERRPIGRVSVAIGGPLRRQVFRLVAAAETGRNAERAG